MIGSGNSLQKHVWRARIVLLSADPPPVSFGVETGETTGAAAGYVGREGVLCGFAGTRAAGASCRT
jgi:hypothetical protein